VELLSAGIGGGFMSAPKVEIKVPESVRIALQKLAQKLARVVK